MKIAIITGASSGMGKEFAIQIAARFIKLDEIWIVARRKELLEQTKLMILGKCVRCFPIDLTCGEDMEEFRKTLMREKPNVKILVNAAGYGKIGSFEKISEEDQIGMVDLNCTALTKMTKMVLPYMQKNGRIINFASAAAFSPQPDFAVYAASKAYVLSFSRALREELRIRKINVTAVCPGPVETEFFVIAGNKEKFDKIKRAEPRKVVKQALDDAVALKSVSVYGAPMKAARLGSKLAPTDFIVKLFN